MVKGAVLGTYSSLCAKGSLMSMIRRPYHLPYARRATYPLYCCPAHEDFFGVGGQGRGCPHLGGFTTSGGLKGTYGSSLNQLYAQQASYLLYTISLASELMFVK